MRVVLARLAADDRGALLSLEFLLVAAILVLGIVEGIFMVFQQPVAQGLLADASPPEARGRAQGIAGAIGAIGGATAAFASLPLYHYSRPVPFVLAGAAMTAGSIVAAAGAMALVRRRRASPRQPAPRTAEVSGR